MEVILGAAVMLTHLRNAGNHLEEGWAALRCSPGVIATDAHMSMRTSPERRHQQDKLIMTREEGIGDMCVGGSGNFTHQQALTYRTRL